MRTLTVDRGEVDGLRTPAHLGSDLIDRNIEDDRCGLAMNVSPRAKGFDESGIIGQVRKQAKLDLGVVGREQRPASLRDEPAPDIPAKLAPDGNILEIRITRGEASGCRDRLVE